MFGYLKRYILPLLAAMVTAFVFLFLFGRADFSKLNEQGKDIKESEEIELVYGEVTQVGDFRYNIIELEETEAITLENNQVKLAEEDEKFIVAYFYVKTGEKKNISLTESMFALYDEKNRKYKNLDVKLKSETFESPFRFYRQEASENVYLVFSIPKEVTPHLFYIGANKEYETISKKTLKNKQEKDPYMKKYFVIPEIAKD